MKVTQVVRTKFESSRVIFRKVTRVESFPKKIKVTRVESESLKNATRVRLCYAQTLWRGSSQALLCAWSCNHRLIVDIKSQQGWLSNYLRFSINNTR